MDETILAELKEIQKQLIEVKAIQKIILDGLILLNQNDDQTNKEQDNNYFG